MGKKRNHNELLDGKGEQPEGAGERSVSVIVDLDGNRHQTRYKKDISQREKELAFGFRMVDRVRWTHLMGADLQLQPGEYYRMIEEQAKTRSSGREAAYESCGLADQIRYLKFVGYPEKLKFLLTGTILNGTKDSLTFADFESRNCAVASGRQPDVRSNENLILMLKNLEATMVVFFSPFFQGTFSALLLDLEGFKRPLELVSADFLIHSLEVAFGKFFRVVRSQKNSYDTSLDISGPERCSEYLRFLLSELSNDLSDDHKRSRMEEFFTLRLRKEEAFTRLAKVAPAEKEKTATAVSIPSTVLRSSKPICGMHIGSQLNAINDRTKAVYECSAGVACRFAHPTVKGKTLKEISSMIAKLPPVMRAALTSVVKKRDV